MELWEMLDEDSDSKDNKEEANMGRCYLLHLLVMDMIQILMKMMR